MGHSEYDPAAKERRPWNADRMVGAKRALKPQQVSTITLFDGVAVAYFNGLPASASRWLYEAVT